MQVPTTGWDDSWCPNTMGGKCNYDSKGVCKRCKVSREDKLKQQQQENQIPDDFAVQQQQVSIEPSEIQQHEVYQQASSYPFAQYSDDGPIVQQVASSGWNKKWCSATMGGTCKYDENDICRLCRVSRAEKQAE